MPLFVSLIPVVILLLPLLLLKLEGKKLKEFTRELSLDKFQPRASLWRATRLFAAMFVVLLVLANILHLLGLLDTAKVIKLIQEQTPLALFVAVSIAPVGEELFFRGYLQKRVGIIFSSIVFAGLHYGYGSLAEILAAFLISIMLGLELRARNDLNSCILAHAGYNLFSIVLVKQFGA